MTRYVAASLYFLSFVLLSAAQEDYIPLNFKGRQELKQCVRSYMHDSLAIAKIKISNPHFSPYEKDYQLVQNNRYNCDSLIGVPLYNLRVKQRGREDCWEFMLDAKGDVVIVLRTNSDWYREY